MPAKVVYHCILSTKSAASTTFRMFQRKLMRTACPCRCIFYTFFSHYFSFDGLVASQVLFRHIFNIVVPVRGRGHHLALLLKPRKSKLCLWITIHQNKFPLQPPQVVLITEESLFYLYFSHVWPCFWSTAEPGLYLVCPFLPN